MTVCLKIHDNYKFNCYNIGKYLQINNNFIEEIKYCDETNEIQIRSLYNKKRKKTKKKKINKTARKDSFYNQVTLIVKVSDKKTINIKLFKNGSIQMTGCNSLENAKISIEKIFELLNTPRYLLNFKNNSIDTIYFIDSKDKSNISIDKIITGTIALINCNFNIGFEINRDKLYNLITKNKTDMEIKKNKLIIQNIDSPQKYMDCTYDPIRHACVNIKLNHPEKLITIFVFESGSIIILARTCKQLRDAHKFINIFLLTNYFNIFSKNT